MALPLFSVTLFISAFVLFLVQPMIGKMILPRLGGTPQVWNTCMMFFQIVLLAGYSYSHAATTRFSFRKHLAIHMGLLLSPLVLLGLLATMGIGPFDFSGFKPTTGGNPILPTLAWLTLLVGLPFLVVSTTSPLLQRWFLHTGHAAATDPYFLSIASNAGSLLGLLAYPIVVEPTLLLHQQAVTWWVLYALLVAAIATCASLVWNKPELAPTPELPKPEETAPPPPPPPPQPAAAQQTGITRKKFGKGKPPGPVPAPHEPAAAVKAPSVQMRSDEVTWFRRLRWVLLAAAPSSLMLGVVTYICTDLSPIPLLWVIPLALYLITFILVFIRHPLVWVDKPHKFVLFLQPVLVLALCLMIIGQNFASGPLLHISLAILAFFATALVCHGELALDRPPAKHLTEFWLWVSVGGMVGGVFNGLIAPVVFWGVVEFPVAIVLGCLVRPQLKADGWTEALLDRFTPGLVTWFRNQGDALARKYNRPEPHSKYLLNFTLDIILPALLGSALLLLIYTAVSFHWRASWQFNPLFKFWRSFGFKDPEIVRINLLVTTFTFNLVEVTYSCIINFLPMVVCFLFFNRPIRLGLGVAAILLAQVGYQSYRDTEIIYADRSYFGVLRVRASESEGYTTHSLMHGTTHHGLNYQSGPYRRMPTTYYHSYGPAGVVMLQYNWFKDGYRDPLNNLKEQEKLRSQLENEKDNTKKTKLTADLQEVQRRLNSKMLLDGMTQHDSDTRLPASMAGLIAADLAGGSMPIASLVGSWSEPPYATIGLGTGTMAAYGRPFQHVHYYEIDAKIRRLNIPELTEDEQAAVKEKSAEVAKLEKGLLEAQLKLMLKQSSWEQEMKKSDRSPKALLQLLEKEPLARSSEELKVIQDYYLNTSPEYRVAKDEVARARKELFVLGKGPYFNYVMDARKRDAEVQVRMGDARLRMAFDYGPYSEAEEVAGTGIGGGPNNFYHMMVVDAFSSDAIPIHLITKEAIEMYFTKLVPNGILCVHTSNRHVALVPVVEAVAKSIECIDPDTGEKTTLQTRKAHDNSPYGLPGHFTSEWVMVARNRKILEKLITPPLYEQTAEQRDRSRMRVDREQLAAAGWTDEQIDKRVEQVEQQILENATKYKAYTYWLWPEERKAIPGEIQDIRPWTDSYSNVLGVFRWEHSFRTADALKYIAVALVILGFGAVVWVYVTKPT